MAELDRKQTNAPPRSLDGPAPSVTSKAGGQWVVRTGRDTEMGDGTELYERGVDEPAPTVDTSAGTQPWRLTVKATGQKGSRSRSRSRSSEEPSLPVAIAHNQTAWCWERSATAVMGTDRVAPPGYRVAPDDGHMFDEAIPVTLAELAKLQDMPDDYPFVGTKTQRARQIGNLVPPTLAAAIVRELTR